MTMEITHESAQAHDADLFGLLAEHVRSHFDRVRGFHGDVLFTTKSDDLFDIFLSHLPADERQIHACSCCRDFFRKVGGLVCIDADGVATSAVWPQDAPSFYRQSIDAVRTRVEKNAVDGVMVSDERRWGVPTTGKWTHFSLGNPKRHTGRVKTAYQVAAEKREDYRILNRALADFTMDRLLQVMNILQADAVSRAEKFIGPTQFLIDLQEKIAQSKKRDTRSNLVWLAASTAPAGFCSPRSSMIGSLLEDIADGYSFEEVKSRFDAKMHPLRYQRAQTPATSANIERAEKIFEKLNLGSALRRRAARLDEVERMWIPTPESKSEKSGGVFADLKARDAKAATPDLKLSPSHITWEKFARKVLPEALSMRVELVYRMNFGAIVTACDMDAEPLLRWDRPERRNPFSWYVYNGGSTPGHWNLPHRGSVAVTAIVPYPEIWEDGKSYSNHGFMFCLEGAADTGNKQSAIFAETLRPELHEVRKTIEQYSQTHPLEDTGERVGLATGIILGNGAQGVIRVLTKLGESAYIIDRLD